jgi:hypothetical protein
VKEKEEKVARERTCTVPVLMVQDGGPVLEGRDAISGRENGVGL